MGGDIATIVDLKSGKPRLIVDTGVKICGLGVTGSTAIVVGEGKIITWNLPAGDCVLEARADIHDSVRTIVFNHPPPFARELHSASISPDLNYFVITRKRAKGFDIYDMSTGKHLVGTNFNHDLLQWFTHSTRELQPWLTRDGREAWNSYGGHKIIRDEGSDVIGLEPVRKDDGPSGGYIWASSYGHNVMVNGWILDSRKKRVMWLPRHWRVKIDYLVWDERFLALSDPGLPEPIIIELYE